MLSTNYSSAYSIHFIIMKEQGQDPFRKKKGRTRDVLCMITKYKHSDRCHPNMLTKEK